MRTQSGYKFGEDTRAGRRESQTQGKGRGRNSARESERKLKRKGKEGENGTPRFPKAGLASGNTPG